MSLQQPASNHSSSKSQRTARFTIDSILNTSPLGDLCRDQDHVRDSGKASECGTGLTDEYVTSFVVASSDDVASAADRDDPAGASPLPLCSETERTEEDRNQTMFDHVDEELDSINERITADDETEQQRVECSSLLSRTAAAFQRRHQRHVAQLRSFSELFFAQYEQYRRQLRNHLQNHSALQPPSTLNVPPAPPLGPPSAHSLDDHRHPPDVVRSTLNALQWSLHSQRCQLPASTSTFTKPRVSRSGSSTLDWSSADYRSSLLLTRNDVRHTTTPQRSTLRLYSDEDCVVDYSRDRNPTKWTASNNSGI